MFLSGFLLKYQKKCDQKRVFPSTIQLYSLMMFKDQLQIQTAKTATEF